MLHVTLLGLRDRVDGGTVILRNVGKYATNDTASQRPGSAGSTPGRVLSSLRLPDRLWNRRSLLPKRRQALSLSLSEASRSKQQACHSHQTTADIKKAWSYTSSPIHLHDRVLHSAQVEAGCCEHGVASSRYTQGWNIFLSS
jgi:hypothetical protein